jgi:anthranilate phosphoribosyltransferase
MAARRKLGRRTIFNLLGPLTNPAFVRRQVVGVARADLLDTIARALGELGAVRALVVHGHDGLCDLTITGPSSVIEMDSGRLSHKTVTPEELGLRAASPDSLRVQSPAESADAIRAVLGGETGARRDHTLLNAAAALVAAGIAKGLTDGVERAAAAIDSGAAAGTLEKLAALSEASE